MRADVGTAVPVAGSVTDGLGDVVADGAGAVSPCTGVGVLADAAPSSVCALQPALRSAARHASMRKTRILRRGGCGISQNSKGIPRAGAAERCASTAVSRSNAQRASTDCRTLTLWAGCDCRQVYPAKRCDASAEIPGTRHGRIPAAVSPRRSY